MARYIDAEKIDFKLGVPFQVADGELYIGIRDIRKVIAQTPTEDVVPRCEVARKICCEIEEEIVAALESNYKAKAERLSKPNIEMADEFVAYCDGKILALRGIEGFVEELKMKYTEDSH